VSEDAHFCKVQSVAMKKLSIEEIIEEVRIKIDEVNANEQMEGYSDVESSNVNNLIAACINEGYRLTMLSAPQSMLEGKKAESVTLSINEKKVGTLSLPNDFLRLVNVRLDSWISSCSNFITEDDPMYRMQSNDWICGNPQSPVVAVVDTDEGKKLELYKASSEEDKLKVFTYIPIADISGDIEMSEQLVGSFINYTAGLVLAIYKEENAEDFFKVARSLMGLE
jgi:hypothetical protein